MAIYTDAQDIRQHVRGAQGAPVPQIEEIMEEVEAYVAAELDLDPLPPNNPVLRGMIRELTTSRIILDLLPIQADNIARAEMHETRGLRMLKSAKVEGILPHNRQGSDPSKEVINPFDGPFFPREQFLP